MSAVLPHPGFIIAFFSAVCYNYLCGPFSPFLPEGMWLVLFGFCDEVLIYFPHYPTPGKSVPIFPGGWDNEESKIKVFDSETEEHESEVDSEAETGENGSRSMLRVRPP